MNANDPAFPELKESFKQQDGDFRHWSVGGLTKREYFAAMAMQGLLANPTIVTIVQDAKSAVASADALLAELARTEPKEAA